MPAVATALVRRAADGDRDALEAVLRAVEDDVFRLSVRMLWHPADAEDATQEILVKIATRLDGFRGEAAFTTWAYRIALNHLLSTRRRRAEHAALSFDEFAADLAQGLDEPYDAGGVDERLLEDEVKVGCTQAMLLCLDRAHRAAWILGEVFELPGAEAAAVLEISPAAYRKRLSRARQRIQTFMRGHCGLLDAANACRCSRRVGTAIGQRRVDPQNLLFARHVEAGVRGMERLHDAAAVFRSHPELRAPDDLVAMIARTLERPTGSSGVNGAARRPGPARS
jgi:RNA polymerase sigma factor (sigma-70 family)